MSPTQSIIDSRRAAKTANGKHVRIGPKTKYAKPWILQTSWGYTYLQKATKKNTHKAPQSVMQSFTSHGTSSRHRVRMIRNKKNPRYWEEMPGLIMVGFRMRSSKCPEFSRCTWSQVPYSLVHGLSTANMRSRTSRLPEEATEDTLNVVTVTAPVT